MHLTCKREGKSRETGKLITPTGKSLCWVASEPLRVAGWLLGAQVNQLEAAGINARCFETGNVEVAREIFQDLRSAEPTIRLLYVTPEKVSRSDQFIREIDGLHRRGKLVRARLTPRFG